MPSTTSSTTLTSRCVVRRRWLRFGWCCALVLGVALGARAQTATGSIVSVLQEGPNTRISIEAEEDWTVQNGAAGFVRSLLGASRSRTARFTVREVRGQRVEADVVEFRTVPIVGDPVLFTQGASLTVNTRIERGILRVATEPRGATVYIDGEEQGTAPLTLERPLGTTVQVAVELEGYRSQSRLVPVSRADATVRYQLGLVREGATLILSTFPVGADVLVADEVLGETPFRYFFDPGLVEIELRKDGFRSTNIVVEIPESGVVRRTDSLSLARSRLDLIADREALVVLNGDTLGVSPQEALGREPATYAVWFLSPGFDPHIEYVELSEPGEVKEVRAMLRAPGTRVEVWAEPEGTQVLLDGTSLGTAPVNLRVPPGTYELSVQRSGSSPVARPEPLVIASEGEAVQVAVRIDPGNAATWVLGDTVPEPVALPTTEPEPTPTSPEQPPREDSALPPAYEPSVEPLDWTVRVEFDTRHPLLGGAEAQRAYTECIQDRIPEDLSASDRVALLFDSNGDGRVTGSPIVVRGSQGWLTTRASQCFRVLTFEERASDVLFDIEVVQE